MATSPTEDAQPRSRLPVLTSVLSQLQWRANHLLQCPRVHQYTVCTGGGDLQAWSRLKTSRGMKWEQTCLCECSNRPACGHGNAAWRKLCPKMKAKTPQASSGDRL